MKVLIAEDEPISNLWLKNTLTRWGYEAISTRDGYEAWEVLNESDFPRVVILDWEMPKMKGIEVCEKNKERPPAKQHIYNSYNRPRPDRRYGGRVQGRC